MTLLTVKNVARGLGQEEVEACGVRVVGWYGDGKVLEVTVEARERGCRIALSRLGEVHRCERVTMFGVQHDVSNAEIAKKCNVTVAGNHLCGNHSDNTKDVTVVLGVGSDIHMLGSLCMEWKSVSPLVKPPYQTRNSSVVLMLQVVLSHNVGLTKDDKVKVLEEYLKRIEQPSVRCYGAKSKRKQNRTYTPIFTLYLACERKAAELYLDPSRPLLDAVPFTTESGATVYLNTIQKSTKPGVYENGEPYVAYLPLPDAPVSPSSHSLSEDTDLMSATDGSSDTCDTVKQWYRYDPYLTSCSAVVRLQD